MENGRRLKSTFFYKIKHRDGSETIEECTSESPVMPKEAYISLLSEAGFDADVYIDYQEKVDDGASTILCFVCRKN